MRNISAALTKDQIRASVARVTAGLSPIKDVTRRLGWKNLKVGERLQVCEKCQGLKPGEALVRICVIEVVSVRRERLNKMKAEYGIAEAFREGFPHLDGAGFVKMFCEHMDCQPSTAVTRIEFKYVL